MSFLMRAIVVLAATSVLSTTLGGSASAVQGDTGSGGEPTLTERIDGAIADIAAEIDGDAQAAMAFVDARISPEAYDGVLKGARGALLTGRANSADQAILMAALMRASPRAPATRFALCEMPRDLDPLRVDAPRPRSDPAFIEDRAQALASRMKNPEFRDAILGIVPWYATVTADVDVAAQELTQVLEAADWSAADSPEVGTAAPKLHVWLQAEEDGVWRDFDPTSEGGVPPCELDTTFVDLPQEMFHHLRIALTVETNRAGSLVETTALDTDLPLADLATSRIAFTFAEPSGLLDRQRHSDTDWPYTPVLRIDNETIEGESLLLPPILPPVSGALKDAVGGLGGLTEKPPEVGTDVAAADRDEIDGRLARPRAHRA